MLIPCDHGDHAHKYDLKGGNHKAEILIFGIGEFFDQGDQKCKFAVNEHIIHHGFGVAEKHSFQIAKRHIRQCVEILRAHIDKGPDQIWYKEFFEALFGIPGGISGKQTAQKQK